ncbi:MAG: hypothetical protein LBH87_03450 [Coriobacteriales bacterium]|jgi:hypothetical protein|nr:hypothetical protein [Coriobacteriales bacterium]
MIVSGFFRAAQPCRFTCSLLSDRLLSGVGIYTYVLYKAPRYDIKGRQHLKSLEKYYVADISLRHLILGGECRDVGQILENIVYLCVLVIA